MLLAAQDSLLSSLRRLQESAEYSDLRIFCGVKIFKVHKVVVCGRSPFFATACKWGKDGESKDEITLEDDDPRLIQLMIDYLYQLDYDDVLSNQAALEPNGMVTDEPSLPLPGDGFRFSEAIQEEAPPLAEPEVVAESGFIFNHGLDQPTQTNRDADWRIEGFGLPGKTKKDKKDKKKIKSEVPVQPRLKDTVRPHLKDTGKDLNADRLTVNTLMYALADKYAIEDLKTLAKKKFDEAVEQDWDSKAFVHAAKLAFDTTLSFDKGLRSTVVNVLNSHRELVDYEEVQDLLDSGNGIAWALVLVLLGGR